MRSRSEETNLATAYMAVLARGVAVLLFISIVAVWAVILGGGA